jgi:hypothetical protein
MILTYYSLGYSGRGNKKYIQKHGGGTCYRIVEDREKGRRRQLKINLKDMEYEN